MNQMNMQGMNPSVAMPGNAVPVGVPGVGVPGGGMPMGGIPMINSASGSAPRSEPNQNLQDTMATQLNTYIYDYFLKRGYHDCARALVQDESVTLNTTIAPHKGTPHRRDGEVNGVDSEEGKEDMKSRIPDDLPRPNLGDSQQTSFLFDWFNIFWDVFSAQRKKPRSNDAMQYLQHTQNMLRLRDQQQNQLMRQGQLMPNQFAAMRGVRGNMVPANLQKSVLQNPQNMTPQQIAQIRNQQMMHHQMQREHSDMEMNGHRPQSPSSVENAPSPSKRQRIDGPQVNGAQMTPNGRTQPQGMPGQQNQQQANSLLMQHGINPRNLTPAQLQSFQAQNPAVQAKSIQVYNQNLIHHTRSAMNNQGIPNGLINPGVMPNQPDMMQPMHDSQGMIPQEYYSNGQMAAQMRQGGMQTPGAQNGNHALQDYQMQLMLLEQQNKKRLLIARQEQDSMARDGQPPPGPAQPGQPGAAQQQQAAQGMHNSLPPGTSPQGSRAGASPNPSEQMKRGTPKMPQTGLPGSPNVGDAMQGRGSPASMNFGNQIPQDMGGAAFFNTMKNMQEAGGVVGPNGMRPPSSNPAYSGAQMTQPMDAMARQQQAQAQAQAQAGARMPSGNWQQPQPPQGQPMIPPQQQQQQQQQQTQQQQGQPGQPVGTPQERNAMPPPQAPPVATAPNNGRQSPQPGSAAPPTPQQSSKPAPKKKDTKDNNRKRPAKRVPTTNAASTAAPASESEPPPTPTPSTPITPVHPNSFNKNAPANNAQPTSAPAAQPQAVGQPPPPPQPPQQQQQQQPQQQQQQMLSMQPAQGQPPAAQPGQAQGQVDPSQPFGDMGLTDNQSFNLDFSSLDNPDILENFDFDTFLNTDDQSAFNFDPNTPYLDGVEAGTGERM
ncbi:OefA protein [Nannizzia gypsea CBS 118893]|uniref:OefA protein n=1 Tax=Arthroderma gypseum (strain ATCC MYA-4604 / CBS 118893) TaxID=535722 RepID=E4UZV7_ARTGP|nr:OefA protein [Nannizzia gypsea CBS 118893]EFR02894.1 OefA protein [Nannizzia gypsea CBS 118893]